MIDKYTLLLNSSYEVLSLIPFKKTIKFLTNNKTEAISNWNEFLHYGSLKMHYPAILRLKKYINKSYRHSTYSRVMVIKRDQNHCQYCNRELTPSQITIDHVIPRSQNGATSFTNCVVSCSICNDQKDNRTPKQAGMHLIREPTYPLFDIRDYFNKYSKSWHPDWNTFLSI